MTDALLTRVNEQFLAHRQVCKVCASDGPGVCELGMKILRIFHEAILTSTQAETIPELIKQ